MADMITRCPKCSTAFRISEDLIKSAKGVVRCGSCLNVFNAQDYLVNKANAKQSSASSSTSRPMSQVVSDLERLAKTTESPQRPASSHATGSPAPNEKLKKPQILKQPQKLKKPTSGSKSLFERPPEHTADEEGEDSIVDEAWALELLKDDSDTNNSEMQIRKVIDSPNNPEKETRSTQAVFSPQEPTTRKVETTYQQDQENTKNLVEAKDRPETVGDTSTPPTAHPNSELSQAAPNKLKAKDQKPVADTILAQNTRGAHESLISNIAAIEPESLDSILKERQTSLFSRILWSCLTAAALLLFVGQVLWLQFHRLNQSEPYRTIYSVACKAISCQLPELKDLSRIQASNLIIRTHPEQDNALVVDVILRNQAPFEQRFPFLRLTFTDLQNNPIATRRLPPNEYLGGELAGRVMMPKDQAIHIGMEIVDPGPKAVSYSIAIEN